MKKHWFFLMIILSATFCFPVSIICQTTAHDALQKRHIEVPMDPYLPPGELQKKRTDAYRYTNSSIFTVQVNVDADGLNIIGDAANEPSIAINPTNPDNMVIGWRQFDNVSSNFRQAGYGFTLDAGQTWTFPGSIDAGTFRSDPVLDCNADGVFHYNSLTSQGYLFTCKVFRSDEGEDWDNGVDARGGDKQWMVIDKTEGEGRGNVYSFWTATYSSCLPGFFTRSVDQGNSYQTCTSVMGNPYWGTLAVGPDGELYTVGVGDDEGAVVSKSVTASDPGASVNWILAEQVYLDGHFALATPINPEGLMGQGYIDVDCSDGPGRGNVYVLASVERPLAGDPADIMFSRSFDGGQTWSLIPARINDDIENDHYQWFGTMSVAPTGRIDATWLDTRDAPAGSPYLSALYYSYSEDYGTTWSVNQRLSELFDPHIGWPQQQKMGDYFDMESSEEGAHLAWANTLNGEQDVYYSFIQPTATVIGDLSSHAASLNLSCYPNPFSGTATIRYMLDEEDPVSVEILNVVGQATMTLFTGIQDAGIHTIPFHSTGMQPGFYYCRVMTKKTTAIIPLMKIR